MPKDRRVNSLSFDRSTASPYHCNSKDASKYKPENALGSTEDVKEWEEARCPICMEPPHNAVLLRCSSFDKGCRTYICDTSARHSNCFDLLCQSFVISLPTPVQGAPPVQTTPTFHTRREESQLTGELRSECIPMQAKVSCPFCRGDVCEYLKVYPARRFMNAKGRSCSSETCNFTGTYSELRKHARSEHPCMRPAEVDPAKKREWQGMELRRQFMDMLGVTEAASGRITG